MNLVTDAFYEFPTSTAQEFLAHLRLTNSIWTIDKREWRHRWLFRGQSSVSHLLIPTIWRKDKGSIITGFLANYRKKQNVESDSATVKRILSNGTRFGGYEIFPEWVENTLDLYYRTRVEIEFIDRLLDQALQRAISVPDYSRIRAFLNTFIGNPLHIVQLLAEDNDGLDQELLKVIHNNSFFALAQHHRIPTRLLDWTTSPLIAAFFAAEGAVCDIQKGQAGEKLAVFAAHEHELSRLGIVNFPFPKSDNPYLHAQRGELTIHNGSSRYLMSGEFPSVDQLLSDDDMHEDFQPKKITLPVGQASDLLRLLAISEGISRDQLMPTFDNIVHVVKQQYELDLLS